jgi:hypothetical protein
MGGGPQIAKFALELYQQFASQLRGAERFEDIIDRAVDSLEKMATAPKPPPPPDPKMVTAQMKSKADMAKAQVDMAKTKMDFQASAAEHQMKMGEIQAETVQAKVENQGEMLRAFSPPKPSEFPLT